MKKRARKSLVAATLLMWFLGLTRVGLAAPIKIVAQNAIEEVALAHPEVKSLELAASRSAKARCMTIASTEAREIGEKCDKDELAAMKTNQPFVEQEKDGFDVTVPLHDSAGNIMGTVGMDFKLESGQSKAAVAIKARQITSELEGLKSRDQLCLCFVNPFLYAQRYIMPRRMRMHRTSMRLLLSSSLAAMLTLSAAAEDAKPNPLETQAKVSKEEATKIALAKVPNGTLKDAEIEKEKGRLIWSFDITTPDTTDITEVELDAKTGAVLSIQKESATAEAAEAKAEAKAKAKREAKRAKKNKP